MAIELQIQSSALSSVVSHAIQVALFRRCSPALDGVFIDHMDVVQNSIKVEDVPGPGIRIQIPIDVYVVTQDNLMQAENADPLGAKAPAGRLVAEYGLAVSGTVLSFSLDDLRSEPPNPLLGPFLETAKASLPSFPGLDLAPSLRQLGLIMPASSDIVFFNGLVAIRFDPTGPAAAHLFSGQEWGLFIDGDGVVGLIRSLLPPLPMGGQVGLTWEPVGNVPRVSGQLRVKPQLPDPFTATVNVPVSVSLGLVSTAPSRIRATVNRGALQIHASGVPGFLEGYIEDVLDGYIAALFDPASVGGTKIDDRSFFLDRSLDPIGLAGAALHTSILAADGSGMTLGGPVRPVYAEWGTISISRSPFGLPSWFGTCRTSRGSAPPKTVKITDVTCYAGVSFSSYGAYCGTTILEPRGIAASYLSQPPPGPDSGSVGNVGFSVPGLVAQGINNDVKFIIRTARGVRFINLGQPIVKIDRDGNVEFSSFWVDDCFYLTDDQTSMIDWVKGKGKGDLNLLNPPLEDPNWLKMLSEEHGLEVQLVTLSGLTPGELLRFRSDYHEIDVTADAAGKTIVPVFLPLSQDAGVTTLERVNRESIAGKFRVKAAVFARGAVLASGAVNQLDVTESGGVRLTRGFDSKWTRHGFGIGGLNTPIEIAAGTAEAELNPQPMPPEFRETFKAAASRLPGFHAVFPIPGFETAPVAVARMRDGSAVLLQEDGSGVVRVSGAFTGPIGFMANAGAWSMSVAGGQITMFEVKRN